MWAFICLLGLFIATTSAFDQCGKRGTGGRIINGEDAGHGEFPWQISLTYALDGHICGGTLLSNEYVLCAAHCFSATTRPSRYRVTVGEWHLNKRDGSEKQYDVERIYIHEGYNYPKPMNNDIALLKLKRPVDLSGPYAGTACLAPKGKDYRGTDDCVLSGFGVIKLRPQPTLANRLQKVTGQIWSDAKLQPQYPNLPDHVLGFGSRGWSGCMGDSGGPLVCPNGSGTYDVVGIVSFGPTTCSGKPGVFTEVSEYRNWLTKTSGGKL